MPEPETHARTGFDAATDGDPAALVARVERMGRRIDTRSRVPGAGPTAWRVWGEGPPVVLLHGGHGSWTHWLRNIPDLARRWTLFVPDMPGYGDSAPLPQPHSVETLAEIVFAGLGEILPEPRFALVGFSFGGVAAGFVARLAGERVRRLVLVGSGGLRLRSPPIKELRAWRRLADPAAREAAHRANLRILMIHDEARIGTLAVHLQARNAERTRVRSRDFSRAGLLRLVLPELKLPLAGIWGEYDATARGHLAEREALLREFDPESEFTVIPGAGHWVQYEAPEAFDRALEGVLANPRA